jgi:membrane associated rhomboid family serine protease
MRINQAVMLVERRKRLIHDRESLTFVRGPTGVFAVLALAGCGTFLGMGMAGGAVGCGLAALAAAYFRRDHTKRLQRIDAELDYIETVADGTEETP